MPNQAQQSTLLLILQNHIREFSPHIKRIHELLVQLPTSLGSIQKRHSLQHIHKPQIN
jgi:hypothetical protein